jgi:hypothetical protein
MVDLESDFVCVLAVEGERQAQIAGDIDHPAIALIAPQRAEAPPGDAHVLRPDGGIQPVKRGQPWSKMRPTGEVDERFKSHAWKACEG